MLAGRPTGGGGSRWTRALRDSADWCVRDPQTTGLYRSSRQQWGRGRSQSSRLVYHPDALCPPPASASGAGGDHFEVLARHGQGLGAAFVEALQQRDQVAGQTSLAGGVEGG